MFVCAMTSMTQYSFCEKCRRIPEAGECPEVPEAQCLWIKKCPGLSQVSHRPSVPRLAVKNGRGKKKRKIWPTAVGGLPVPGTWQEPVRKCSSLQVKRRHRLLLAPAHAQECSFQEPASAELPAQPGTVIWFKATSSVWVQKIL